MWAGDPRSQVCEVRSASGSMRARGPRSQVCEVRSASSSMRASGPRSQVCEVRSASSSMRASGPRSQVFQPKRPLMVASQLRKTFTLLPAQHSCKWYNLIVRLTSQEQE